MAQTSFKVSPQLNACHKLFIDNFVSQMEIKLKYQLEEIGRKEKKEHIYGDKEIILNECWKRHVLNVIGDREMEKRKNRKLEEKEN